MRCCATQCNIIQTHTIEYNSWQIYNNYSTNAAQHNTTQHNTTLHHTPHTTTHHTTPHHNAPHPCTSRRNERESRGSSWAYSHRLVDGLQVSPFPRFPPTTTHLQTARALHTQPSRLPVPGGRHPGLCLLVTAPSAQCTRPRHINTTEQNTTRHNTTQHNATRHNTAQQNATERNTTKSRR